MSTPNWNGFELCGKILPDIALENLLASVPVDEILKLREVQLHLMNIKFKFSSHFHVHVLFQVCKVWRDIILRRTFWKIVCERNGIDWTLIPNHIKENERSWMIFYAACKSRIFDRNFILNHSGHRK